MFGKGFVKFILFSLIIASLYSLSFTGLKYYYETDAYELNGGDPIKIKRYLDSLETVNVVDFGFVQFNYQFIKNRSIPLGLDLQGGMSVTMEISLAELIKNLADDTTDSTFNEALEKAIKRQVESDLDFITLFDEEIFKLNSQIKLADYFSTEENNDRIKFNTPNAEVIQFLRDEAESAIKRSFYILRTRVDKFGVTSPNIQLQGTTNRILVELPGVQNPKRVRKLLQGTANLEFWQTFSNRNVFNILDNINKTLQKSLAQTTTLQEGETASKEDIDKEKFEVENPLFKILTPAVYTENNQSRLSPGPIVGYCFQKDTTLVNQYFRRPEIQDLLPRQIRFEWSVKAEGDTKVFKLYALKSKDELVGPVLAGDVISDARSDFGNTGEPETIMVMNSIGAREWKAITAEASADQNDKQSIAIVLDDAVYSAPVVQNEIPNGISSISGDFTIEETKDLANILKAGRLPAPAHIVEESIVGPTLGAESIKAGLYSSIVGLIVILAFMIFYYNTAGYVANIAVFTNLFFLIGALASIGAVLTLPGIAGIVLTLGMAVDANVLIYERIREALVAGKPLRTSISEGYKMAMSSILDSNITTFLTGVVLYVFGSGPILGFATTLMIGILTSLFTSIFVSRLIFEYLLARKKKINFYIPMTKHTLVNANIPFVKKRKLYYTISLCIIVIGIISFFTKGFTMGVEFEGGRSYIVRYEDPVQTKAIRTAFNSIIDAPVQIKTYGSNNQFKLTTSYMINNSSIDADTMAEQKINEVVSSIKGNKVEIISSQKVGPTIADDIKQSSVYSIIFLIIIVSMYLLFRFGKWQYCMGAMFALVHDVLLILAVFSIFDGILPFSLDIDQAFIAAILTVVGYSINDTVVVFDRIREYLSNKIHAKDPIDKVIDIAVNKTLSRTIITSLTLIFALLVLFIFGGETIRGFSFAMLLGAIVGTYSSICIAAPLTMEFRKKRSE